MQSEILSLKKKIYVRVITDEDNPLGAIPDESIRLISALEGCGGIAAKRRKRQYSPAFEPFAPSLWLNAFLQVFKRSRRRRIRSWDA
jgi:hypothetical protein